jgi:hypothetical protein
MALQLLLLILLLLLLLWFRIKVVVGVELFSVFYTVTLEVPTLTTFALEKLILDDVAEGDDNAFA